MKRTITKPRPGHADLNGAIKYGHRDIRNVLEALLQEKRQFV